MQPVGSSVESRWGEGGKVLHGVASGSQRVNVTGLSDGPRGACCSPAAHRGVSWCGSVRRHKAPASRISRASPQQAQTNGHWPCWLGSPPICICPESCEDRRLEETMPLGDHTPRRPCRAASCSRLAGCMPSCSKSLCGPGACSMRGSAAPACHRCAPGEDGGAAGTSS